MTKSKLALIIIGAVLLLSIIIGIGIFSANSPYKTQLALGYKYLEEGKYEEAILAFNKAIEIEPKKYEAYLALSDVYITLDDYENARKILEQGIEATGAKQLEAALTKIKDVSPIKETLEFEVAGDANNLVVDAKNLKVNVKDSRTATITISGIDVKDSYVTYRSSSDKNHIEYCWQVDMYGNGDGYSVSTAWWAFETGLNEKRAVADMQHSVWRLDSGGDGSLIGDAQMEYTSDSMTWTFSVPDDYPFDFSKVTKYEVKTLGKYNSPSIERIYNLK